MNQDSVTIDFTYNSEALPGVLRISNQNIMFVLEDHVHIT